MICKKCGTEFLEGIFCPECGEKVLTDLDNNNNIEHLKGNEESSSVDKEIELLKQKNENMRLEKELAEKKEIENKRIAEERRRTYKGILYASVEEMHEAMQKDNEKMAIVEAEKKIRTQSIVALVTAIATWPLLITMFLWLPSYVISIIYGIKVLKSKTQNKGIAIASLVINIFFIFIIILDVLLAFMEI